MAMPKMGISCKQYIHRDDIPVRKLLKHFLCLMKCTTSGIHVSQARHFLSRTASLFFYPAKRAESRELLGPFQVGHIPQSVHSKRRHSEQEALEALFVLYVFVLNEVHHIWHTCLAKHDVFFQEPLLFSFTRQKEPRVESFLVLPKLGISRNQCIPRDDILDRKLLKHFLCFSDIRVNLEGAKHDIFLSKTTN
ncbi:hypothetical protein GOP47_0027996 [Adiantum capillus-veneris]|nr:hypothetical protein GOP47_0027996 [Adiantum capillus-veneris]